MLDYLHDLTKTASLDAAWLLHCEAMSTFGFDRMIYGHTRFLTEDMFDLDDTVFLSNHDKAYFDRYIGDRLFLHAPMIRWARGNIGACSWGELWQDSGQISEEERKIIAFNRSMNVTAGYSISFAKPGSRSFGLIALAARPGLDQEAVDSIWKVDGRTIEAMNHVFHLKILSLPHHRAGAALTERQREVLEWVGVGKSNRNIATILGISLPTVEKHLRSAREKLGVETTAQAVLKASFQNQIYFH